MSLTRTQMDRTTLPPALLPLAKEHMRVEFTRDDNYITGCIGRAIELFTRLTEFDIFASEYEWVPSSSDMTMYGLKVPVHQVSDVTAVDADGNDISDELTWKGPSGTDYFGESYIVVPLGAASTMSGSVVTLTTGYAVIADLPYSIQDIILRIAAWMYENREMQNMEGVDVKAYANSLLAGYWVPRC